MCRRRSIRSFLRIVLGAVLLAIISGCGRQTASVWKLTDITGHLPDLHYNLTADNGRPTTAAALQGKIALLFFGYAHCPDICPMTLARLAGVLKRLGPDAESVRILFVSVDPYRDTPELLERYVHAFSSQAIGLTGSPAQIQAIAKRYRVAYQADPPDADGNYAVMHSKAVYVFDQLGHARLLASDTDSADAMVHDLKQLLAPSRST